jgi:hypothetical protein
VISFGMTAVLVMVGLGAFLEDGSDRIDIGPDDDPGRGRGPRAMSHWIIAPVVLPALIAPLIAFVMRYDMPLARTASLAGTTALLVIADRP